MAPGNAGARALRRGALCLAACGAVHGAMAQADSAVASAAEAWNLHGQMTGVVQFHPGFRSDYQGPNSLDPASSGRETIDATLFGALALWSGGEFYANAEIDQGFGLGNTVGMAGFPSGEAYKVGASDPYFRMPRWFLRQTFATGGERQAVAAGANQLSGMQPADRVVVTLGKFAVVDLFDTDRYAHDPRADFLNWSVIDAGAFDYAADAWGYSYGAAIEWSQASRTVRFGAFALSRVPNSKELDRGFGQFALIGEMEQRYAAGEHPGKIKALAYLNRGRMGRYGDALDFSRATGAPPDVGAVRRMGSRPGFAAGLEQEVFTDLGIFARASFNDGSKEAYEFTEINRSVSAGLALDGGRWDRAGDTVGAAVAVNAISGAAREYFGSGGLGILIGDGALKRYGLEKILETYYSMRCGSHATVTADFQFVDNPAYNRVRGPVSILGARLHWEY